MNSLLGLPLIISNHALEKVTTQERLFPESRHRSKRILKKLLKRHGGEFKVVYKPAAFRYGNTILIHPAVYEEIKKTGVMIQVK